MNVHNHKIDVYVWQNKNWSKIFELDTSNNFTQFINNNSKDLYAISCTQCYEIYNDYKSNFSFNNGKNFVSLFCNKSSIGDHRYNDVFCFEFHEFSNYILIGTKNEIISFITREFNSLESNYDSLKKTMDSKKAQNEKTIEKMRKDLNKEKTEKEEMGNKLENIKKEKDALTNNLNKEKSLTSELNSKMNELNSEQQNLKNEIANLNKDLYSEKSKNEILNSKLEKISFENNENIKKVLLQVENEKAINKNLNSKIFELKNKERKENIIDEELTKKLREKESLIQNLKNNNMNLGNNLNELKKDLYIKENEIKRVSDSLIKEKNISQNIAYNLNTEKEKNRKLNDKLENIANKNNENVSKILLQLDNEKKISQNLQTKYSELEKLEQLKSKEKEELKSQLEYKEEELKNYIPKNYGLKFQSDSKKGECGEYDIILDINSIISLIKDGWKVNYNQEEGKQKYLKKKDESTIVVGVIGNKNMGKTFILEKLSGYSIPKGFNVKTIGLSVRYGTTPEHNVAILDSAGQETPLLKMEESKIDENEIENKDENENENRRRENQKNEVKETEKKNEEIEEEKDGEFEQYSRDKLITEFFLQKFIIWKSDIIILVVGNISLTEQKLLYTVKQEVKNLDKNKQIFVIHNLKEYSTKEQVNDYIENTLKKLCKIELEKNDMLKISKSNNFDNNQFFNQYFVEKNDKVSHFIFINEFSDNHDYFNTPTINSIQKEIEVVKHRNKFSIIDDCKEFLVKIADEIMEQNIKIENLITEEGEEFDKIILKNTNEITLKSYAVNEVGITFRNDSDEPKYSCFSDLEANKLYIHIELPGGGKNIKKNYEVKGGYNILTFEGEKYGEKQLEEDEKNETKKYKKFFNKIKRNKFKFHVKIATGEIQIIPENVNKPHQAGKFVINENGKGILTVEYNIINYNQKKDKNDDEMIDV